MGHDNLSAWTTTIKRKPYVYYRLGSEKPRYLGPVDRACELAKRLMEICEKHGKALEGSPCAPAAADRPTTVAPADQPAPPEEAAAKSPFEEAKELVEKLRELVKSLGPDEARAISNELMDIAGMPNVEKMKEVIQEVKGWVINNKAWIKRGASMLGNKDPRDISLNEINLNVLSRIVALDAWRGRCNDLYGCGNVIPILWNFVLKMADFADMWMHKTGNNYLVVLVEELRDALVKEIREAAQRYQ